MVPLLRTRTRCSAGLLSDLSAVQLAEAASCLQAVAALSVTACSLLAARQLLSPRPAEEEQERARRHRAPQHAPAGSSASDALAASLAELTWVVQQQEEEALAPTADASSQKGPPKQSRHAWAHLLATEAAPAPPRLWPSGAAGGASSSVVPSPPLATLPALWDLAQHPLFVAAQTRTQQHTPRPAKVQPAGASAAASASSALANAPLPPLLLLALAPAPRRRLLLASMAALRDEMEALRCAAGAGGGRAQVQEQQQEELALRLTSAAVLRAGRAWAAQHPQLASSVSGVVDPSVSATTEDADGALALRVTESALELALLESSRACVEGGALGGRGALYGALAASLGGCTPTGSSPISVGPSRATPWDARGALLGAAVLQDQCVVVAEAVACAYVAWARGEPGQLAAGITPSISDADAPSTHVKPAPPPRDALAARALLLPRLRATRALERFRNEVALHRATHALFTSVQEVFEDRQPLWGIGPQAVLLRREVPLSRRAELDALAGARRTVSVLLEACDVVGPLLQRAGRWLGELLSFLLVRLIGRSLGLVARGVRQSVQPGAQAGA